MSSLGITENNDTIMEDGHSRLIFFRAGARSGAGGGKHTYIPGTFHTYYSFSPHPPNSPTSVRRERAEAMKNSSPRGRGDDGCVRHMDRCIDPHVQPSSPAGLPPWRDLPPPPPSPRNLSSICCPWVLPLGLGLLLHWT